MAGLKKMGAHLGSAKMGGDAAVTPVMGGDGLWPRQGKTAPIRKSGSLSLVENYSGD